MDTRGGTKDNEASGSPLGLLGCPVASGPLKGTPSNPLLGPELPH